LNRELGSLKSRMGEHEEGLGMKDMTIERLKADNKEFAR
jgi:hypothetical protein